MPRPLLGVLLVLATQSGCPYEWGRGGTIDRALEKDMREYYQMNRCALDEEQWLALCGRNRRTSPADLEACPVECQPSRIETQGK